MAWAVPLHSKQQVDLAGGIIIDPEATPLQEEEAFQIVNNWRACHYFPLNTFQVGLRRKAQAITRKAIVAQRIKRLSSIKEKLDRFKSKDLTLSEMQDIGGCRAIVTSVKQVRGLVKAYEESWQKHELVDHDDYIKKPKSSGYRSYHLIYRYFSDKNKTYNGLKIEVQLRSHLQHIWATAVETVGTFTHQALKSGAGQRDWRRFFALMSADFAIREHTAPVPKTPTDKAALKDELRHYCDILDVENRLRMYRVLPDLIEDASKDFRYRLIVLDVNKPNMESRGFLSNQSEEALKEYLDIEIRIADKKGMYAVLVMVDKLELLKKAYPNYFLDVEEFVTKVSEAIS